KPEARCRRSVDMTRYLLIAALTLTGCRHLGTRTDVAAEPAPSTASAPVETHVGVDPGNAGKGTPLVAQKGHELAAFAGGCFWGTEDLFRQVPGVTATAVGYTGGHTSEPTYEDVCTHTTG